MAKRDFPRVDVTLHISGLFRDMFPGLIALFHDAAGAVAALDEERCANPLTQFRGGPLDRISAPRRALTDSSWRSDFARLMDDARGFGRGFSRRGRSCL